MCDPRSATGSSGVLAVGHVLIKAILSYRWEGGGAERPLPPGGPSRTKAPGRLGGGGGFAPAALGPQPTANVRAAGREQPWHDDPLLLRAFFMNGPRAAKHSFAFRIWLVGSI